MILLKQSRVRFFIQTLKCGYVVNSILMLGVLLRGQSYSCFICKAIDPSEAQLGSEANRFARSGLHRVAKLFRF